MPDVQGAGYNLVGGAYRGVAVPKSTPADVQAKLADVLAKINADPDFIRKMEEGGFAMLNVGPTKMAAFNAEVKARYEGLAKDMGIVKK